MKMSMEGLTGSLFEEETIPVNQQEWPMEKYGELMKERKFEEARAVELRWVLDQKIVSSRAEWYQMKPEERTNTVLEWFKNHQPDVLDPYDPRAPNGILRALWESVLKIIAKESGGKETVDLYSTLHSMPDSCYGIDAFLDVNGINFSLDVTLNRSKLDHKADMILRPDMLLGYDEEIDPIKVESVARIIVDRIKRRKKASTAQLVA